MQRISGKNIDVNVGDLLVHVDKATLELEDSTAVAKDNGIPNGWVDGEVSASGELEVDVANLKMLTEAAKAGGSWKALPEFDILFYANTGTEEFKVEAFGCKIKISSLLDKDSAGGNKHVSKLPFDVTDPDFVRINGVPYLAGSEIDNLIKG